MATFLLGSDDHCSAVFGIERRQRWIGRIVQVGFDTVKTLQLRDPEVSQDPTEENTTATITGIPAVLALVCDVRQPFNWVGGSAQRSFDLFAEYSELALAYLSTDASSCPCFLDMCILLHNEKLRAGTHHDCAFSKLKVDLRDPAGLDPRTICTLEGLEEEETSASNDYFPVVSLEQLHLFRLARRILFRRTRFAHTGDDGCGWGVPAPNVEQLDFASTVHPMQEFDTPEVQIEALVQQMYCNVHHRSLFLEPDEISLPFRWRGPVVANLQLATTDTLYRLTGGPTASQLLAQIAQEEDIAYNGTAASASSSRSATLSRTSASSRASNKHPTNAGRRIVHGLALLVDKTGLSDLLDHRDTISLSCTNRLLRRRLVTAVFPTSLCVSVDEAHAIPAAQMDRLCTLVSLLESDQQLAQQLCHALVMWIHIDRGSTESVSAAVTPCSQWLPGLIRLVRALACDPVLVEVKHSLYPEVVTALCNAGLMKSDGPSTTLQALGYDSGTGKRFADWAHDRHSRVEVRAIYDQKVAEALWSTFEIDGGVAWSAGPRIPEHVY